LREKLLRGMVAERPVGDRQSPSFCARLEIGRKGSAAGKTKVVVDDSVSWNVRRAANSDDNNNNDAAVGSNPNVIGGRKGS
jgi:hypothetical protein